ncbi:EpsG family protein [Photobacterium leiognathi]|uniref:EpsG family protein n=1 Tax=Photobacterium leiognathi TaxID=553611 RepID=UPI003DA13F99
MCLLFICLLVFCLFLNPILSIPTAIMGLTYVKSNYKKQISNVFLAIFCLLFILIFLSRIYGFQVNGVSDDAPGYYRWYLSIINASSYEQIYREPVFWLPTLLFTSIFGVLSEFNFFLVVYAYIFVLFFFACKFFGKYSLVFFFCFIFLFHANIYAIAHIFRQTIALFFILIYIGLVINSKYKLRFLFLLLALFSHSSSFIILLVFEFSLIIKNKKYFIAFIFISLFFVLSIYFYSSLPSDVLFKINYYKDNFYSSDLIKRQIFLVLITSVFLIVFSTNKKINFLLYSLIFIEISLLLISNSMLNSRINLFAIPVVFYLLFFSLVLDNSRLSKYKNLIVFLLITCAVVNTILTYNTQGFALVKELSNGNFSELLGNYYLDL